MPIAERTDCVSVILAPYCELIKVSPALKSLLYDADMPPERCCTTQGAAQIVAVCTAWMMFETAAAELRKLSVIARLGRDGCGLLNRRFCQVCEGEWSHDAKEEHKPTCPIFMAMPVGETS